MKKVIIFLVLTATVLSCFPQVSRAVDKNDAERKLKDAEEALASAYVAVFDAEEAGANVSKLFERLKRAGEMLAEANNAFRFGNYSRAYDCASGSINIVQNIVSEAEALKEEAQKNRSEKLFLSAAYSSVGLSFIFVFSLFGWRYLKRIYVKKFLKMKPEVTSQNESR